MTPGLVTVLPRVEDLTYRDPFPLTGLAWTFSPLLGPMVSPRVRILYFEDTKVNSFFEPPTLKSSSVVSGLKRSTHRT